MNINVKIDKLWAETKAGKIPREQRFNAIERLIDDYIEAHGKRPEPAQLDRLATLCLYEEVTDNDRMKMRNNEFPIASDRQLERRDAELVGETWAESIAVDGRDHAKQTRNYRRKLRNL